MSNMKTPVSQVRFFCTKHNVPLKNCGNGRILDPTDGDPEVFEDGWFNFDTSEYSCPKWTEVEQDDCSEHHEVQVA